MRAPWDSQFLLRRGDQATLGIFCGLLTEALALVGGPVDEDLGADDVAEGQEHLHQLGVAKLLGGELVSFHS